MISFKNFWPLWSVSSRFWAGHRKDNQIFSKNCDSMFYTCVPHAFYFALRSMSVGRGAEAYEECSNLDIFSRLGFFSKFLGGSRSGLYYKYMHEMTRMPDSALCVMVFIFLSDGCECSNL